MKKNFKGKIKRKYLLIILLFIAVLSLVGYKTVKSFEKNLTEEEKVEDFLYLYDVVEKSYPYLEVNERVNNFDWLAYKENYLAKIKDTKTDAQFIKELNNILGDLNNNHTHLFDNYYTFEFFKDTYYKFGWYNFWDDEVVKNRYESLGNKKLKKRSSSTKDFILKDVVEGKVGYIYLPEMTPRGESIE